MTYFACGLSAVPLVGFQKGMVISVLDFVANYWWALVAVAAVAAVVISRVRLPRPAEGGGRLFPDQLPPVGARSSAAPGRQPSPGLRVRRRARDRGTRRRAARASPARGADRRG